MEQLLPIRDSFPIIPLIIAIFIVVLFLFFRPFFVVNQQNVVILERLGKFLKAYNAGLHFKIPFIDQIAGSLNLKIRQLDVMVETKTNDNVFVKLKIAVQYQVMQSSVDKAFYELQNPTEQITSYVFDVIRAEVPKLKLDDVFIKKDDIANAVKGELAESMQNYGYNIVKALVTDIDPDEQVKLAMNRINSAEREKVAAEYEAEAERIKIVAKAKAEAESKRLQGQGIADQRREITRGLEESVKVLNSVNINSKEASALIVVTQHYDTLNAIGASSKSNLILLPNSPTAASDMLTTMISSFSAAQQINEKR